MATIQSTIMLGCDGLTDLYVAQQESDLTAGWSVSQLALRNYQFAASNAMTKSVHDSLAALVTAAQAVLGAGSWPTGALAVEVLSGLVGDVRNGNFIPAGSGGAPTPQAFKDSCQVAAHQFQTAGTANRWATYLATWMADGGHLVALPAAIDAALVRANS